MQNCYTTSQFKVGKESSLDADDDVDDYENLSEMKPPPVVPTRAKNGHESSAWKTDLVLTHLNPPTKPPQGVCTVSQRVNIQEPSRFQPPALGLDFSSPSVNSAFRDETGFKNYGKPKKNGKLIPVLLFVLTSMLLLLAVLLGFLFMRYSTISADLMEIKLNVSNFQKTADKEHNDLKINLTANREVLGKLCKTCPRSWIASGNNCYYFSSTQMTWDEARSECNKFSSELVKLSSKNETDALNMLFRGSTRYWIGLRRDREKKNVWKWLDKTEAIFTFWDVNEPNFSSGREHCGETLSGPWNDRDCNDKLNFICMKVWVC